MLENHPGTSMRAARTAGLLGAAITLSACGTSNGVLQSYPSNAGYNATSTAESGRIRETTLWSGPPGAPEPLRVAVWCEPHETAQTGFSSSSCAFSILLEDYERPRRGSPSTAGNLNSADAVNAAPAQGIAPLAEQFADCATSGKEEFCRQRRNVLQSFLMKTAHANCLSYLRRVFATKEIGDTSVSVVKDTLTGGSVAGAAAGSPPVAGALGLLNLLTGTYSKVDSAMFQGATARVLADAIEQAQSDYLSSASVAASPLKGCTTASLGQSATYAQCDVFQLLDFANGYAAACSLKNGLGILEANVTATRAQKAASEASSAATQALTKVNQANETAQQMQAQIKELPAVEKKADEAKSGLSQLQGTVDALAAKIQALESRNVQATPVPPPVAGPSDPTGRN